MSSRTEHAHPARTAWLGCAIVLVGMSLSASERHSVAHFLPASSPCVCPHGATRVVFQREGGREVDVNLEVRPLVSHTTKLHRMCPQVAAACR
jgi:hypothetical protein